MEPDARARGLPLHSGGSGASGPPANARFALADRFHEHVGPSCGEEFGIFFIGCITQEASVAREAQRAHR